MAQLIKGMFGTEFNPNKDKPFGLSCGQMRGGTDKLGHNSGWYNQKGEKLGWGDISRADFRRIVHELNDGNQVFIILSEQDSFWRFVKKPTATIGSMQVVEPTADAPGVDYVVSKAIYAITKGGVFVFENWSATDTGYMLRTREWLRAQMETP